MKVSSRVAVAGFRSGKMTWRRRQTLFAVLSLAMLLITAPSAGALSLSGPSNLGPPTQSTSGQANPPATQGAKVVDAEITLDNVTITSRTPFLPSSTFGVADAGSLIQQATSSSTDPFNEYSIIAVPFGTTPPSEALPVAAAGIADDYRKALRDGRKPHESEFDPNGPTSSMFGQAVTSQVSLLQLKLNTEELHPTLYVEWVVEAGARLWVVRIVRRLPEGESLAATRPFLESLGQLVVSSDTLDQPSTLTGKDGRSAPSSRQGKKDASSSQSAPAAPPMNAATPVAPGIPDDMDAPSTLFFPPWWNGNCNVNNYPGSYPLGGSYLHMPACGPRGTEWYVNFGTGGLPQPQGWGALQWQCVELVLRYMRLRLNINPYPGNGYEIVDNYASTKANYNPNGPELEVVVNGGQPPAPQPGDILSYGGPPTGHTSLVRSVNVNSAGNGTITIVEQNNSAGGSADLQVQNWQVIGNAGAVTKWLKGNQDYQPAMGQNQDGRLEAFTRGRDGALWHSFQSCLGCGWSGWASEGGVIKGNPAVVRHQNGLQEIYARGSAGDMFRKWQVCPNCNWTGWVGWSAPVKFQGSPAAIINGVGGAHVFGWGADNQVWYTWQQSTSGAWSAWTSLGGLSTSDPAIGLDASNRVTVFIRGIDNVPYYRQQLAANSSSWTNWTPMGGIIDGNLAVGRNNDGRLEVFGRGTDTSGAMYHNWQNTPNGTWSGWYSLGGVWSRDPVVGRNSNGHLEVFAVQGGTDPNYTNQLYHASQLNGWNGWSPLGGNWRVGLPGVNRNADGRLEFAVRGDNRQMYNVWQTSLNSMSWSCCGSLGGDWP